MREKVRVTFVLPGSLMHDLKSRVMRDGYDLKGKSRWIAEAIEDLLATASFPDLVKISDNMHGFQKLESIVIPKALKQQIDQAIISIRRAYSDLEGVQSRIVRTAIMQRILRKFSN